MASKSTVFITGAGSGIGAALARAYAKQGARIVISDIDANGLSAVKKEIEEAGGEALSAPLDVTDSAAFENLAEQLAAKGWLPNIVINNAGIGHLKGFADTTLDDWKQTLDINVMGVVHGCKIFSALWSQENTSGHLVNISSVASRTPVPNMSAYAASKAAVENLSMAMAMENDPSIAAISCVHPGIINTSIVAHDDKYGFEDERIRKIQKYYAEQGSTPDSVALEIIAGVKKRKHTIPVGKGARLSFTLKRILPGSTLRRAIVSTAKDVGFSPS